MFNYYERKGPVKDRRPIPTISFTHDGRTPKEIAELAEADVGAIQNGKCPVLEIQKFWVIYNELESYEFEVDLYDPWANKTEVAGTNSNYTSGESWRGINFDPISFAVPIRIFKLDLDELKKDMLWF
ncbi:hypothetical protein FQA39_LY19270 [Lamprigera yunnana]|nr:hypothetical protein FQA39_LY19270 [Lamprigera yunnana]